MSKKFPFYKQHDEMDCGAACLRMIARHYGRFYSLEYIRELSYVDKLGVSLTSISDAAEQLGFQTLGAKVSFKQLAEDLPLPAIVHWKQRHFVVVYKVSNKYVWIADPARDKLKISKTEFLEAWSQQSQQDEPMGIVLLLETTNEFFERGEEEKPKSSIGYVLDHLRKYRGMIIQVIAGLLVSSLLFLAFPFLIESLVDRGVNNKDVSFVYLILVSLLVLFISQTLVEHFRSWILLHVGARVNITLISDFLIKIMRLPMRFFDSRLTGEFITTDL